MGFLINNGKTSHIKGTNPGPTLPKITVGSVLSLLGTSRPTQRTKQAGLAADVKKAKEIESKRSRSVKK